MTNDEIRKLETILGKVETLQGQTRDMNAKGRLSVAKDELIRLLNDNRR